MFNESTLLLYGKNNKFYIKSEFDKPKKIKRTIRYNTFETNSSSQHSICVTKRDVHVDPEEFDYDSEKYPHSDECLWLWNGKLEVGDVDDGYERWPFQMLTTFKDKLKYAICEFLGYKYVDDDDYDDILEEFNNICREVVPGFESLKFHTHDVDIYLDENGDPIPRRKLKYEGWNEENDREIYSYLDADGNKKTAKFDEENYYDAPAIGMIDHQSAGLLTNFLKDKGISLKEFLTNKKYTIIVDGDEYDTYRRMKNSGFINLDFIVEEYDKSGEDVEWERWKEEHKDEESNT